jgi:hypothetical protein
LNDFRQVAVAWQGTTPTDRERRRDTTAKEIMSEVEAHFRVGIDLFNRCEFFEAHEEMEEAMNSLEDDTSDWDFYLGLLRAAVANHKLSQGLFSSASLHLRAALKFLAPYADRHRGLKLREFRGALSAELARIEALPAGSQAVISPPRIETAY